MHEGRELYVANVDWSATEDEVKQVFSKYGTVEKVRLPTNVAGKSKGMAFVVFSNKVSFLCILRKSALTFIQDEANAAQELNLTKFKSRLLNVSLSTNNPAKRQATTIIPSNSRTSASPSPSVPPTNGDAASPTTQPIKSTSPPPPSSSDIKARTVALLNISDTVNDARIRALVEPFGPLVKIILRPDHQGAIIEFADLASVGKASLTLEGTEIVPGRKITVGTVSQMLKQKAEWRKDKIEVGGGKKESDKPMTLQPTGPIRRPNQPGARRGGKGGLGMKRGGVGLGGDRAKNKGPAEEGVMDVDVKKEDPTEEAKPKSNSDFKAMFLKESKE